MATIERERTVTVTREVGGDTMAFRLATGLRELGHKARVCYPPRLGQPFTVIADIDVSVRQTPGGVAISCVHG